MFSVLISCVVSFLITLLAIPAIMRVAREKRLYDLPDARKLHTRPIASLGGVGIFLGFIVSCLLTMSTSFNPEFQAFFAAAIVIFFLGLKDDILVLSATKKFLVQLAVAAILIHLGDLKIESFHGFMSINAVPDALGIPLTYMTIIVIINAFNLIDGVDGLAGSLGLLTMTVFGAYFYVAEMPGYSMLAFSMAGGLAAFLIFNYYPAKIFMGDSGSTLLGLMNAIMVLKFINVADVPQLAYPLPSAVAIGFSILIVPLLDTLRVFSIRLSKGRSPFSPDRNHIHHLLLDRGLNHRYVTISCLTLNILFIACAYFGRSLGPTYLLVVMTGTWFTLVGALIYFKKPAPKLVVASSFQHSKETSTPAPKLVSMKNEPAMAE